MHSPQNDGFSLLGFVVFIAVFILEPEMGSPKTSEVRNPELFFQYPIFRFLPCYSKYPSSYLF